MTENKPLLKNEQQQLLPNFANPKHYYEVLALPHGTSIPDIQKQYQKLQEEYQLKDQNDELIQEEMELMKTAYEILTDPQRKLVFDKIGEEGLTFLPYIKGAIPLIKTILTSILIVLLIITILIDLWIVLLLVKLDKGLDLSISTINIILYIFLFILIPIHRKTISFCVGLFAHICRIVGLICLISRIDQENETTVNYHFYLIPLYMSIVAEFIANFFDDCFKRRTRDEVGNVVFIERNICMKITNFILRCCDIIAQGMFLLAIGEAGNNENHNCLKMMAVGIVSIIITCIVNNFKDFTVTWRKAIPSISLTIFILVQFVLICINVGELHSFAYSFSMIPSIIVIVLLNILCLLYPIIAYGILLPFVNKFAKYGIQHSIEN